MAIWDLYSKRQADAARSGADDVYQYTQVSSPLRVQITQIAIQAIGKVARSGGSYGFPDVENSLWTGIEKVYCREKGIYKISTEEHSGSRIISFMSKANITDWLDLLELICKAIMVAGHQSQYGHRSEWEVEGSGADAIDEINYRLRQATLGYQYESGNLLRIDSQYIHAEVVKPALSLLNGPAYAGPREEFTQAHSHYRKGEHRQAVAMAANSLESTLKAVFEIKGWPYTKGARISDLMKVARANKLWPEYLDTSFDQLVTTIQSGLPKIRDNDAAHGQGAAPKVVPSYVAAYALHLAASKIVFIIEASK